MPLDQYLARNVAAIRDLTDDVWTDPESRARLDAWNVDPAPWAVPEGVEVADEHVPGPHGAIRVRRYRSAAVAPGRLLWAHGGGFSSGDLDMLEAQIPAAELCARTGWEVVSVDYRLAVDGVRFPVPLDDVAAAWRWTVGDVDSGTATAIGGASAGAALSLGAAVLARDGGERMPDAMLLAYPFAHFPVAAPSDEQAAELAELPPAIRVTPSFIEEIVRNYVGRISDLPTLAVPGSADLRGLPRAHVIVSELDDLRASGELLVRQLVDAGGSADLHLARGMPHGHLDRRPSLPEVDRSLAYFARALHETAQGHQ